MTHIITIDGHTPQVGQDVFTAPTATLSGDVVMGDRSSAFYGGALVLEGTQVPPRSLVAGVPAKVRRELTEEEVAGLKKNADTYLGLAAKHLVANS